MQETARQALLDEQALVEFSRKRGEPQWLTEARRAAWSVFVAAPWPDRAQHLWRYSDPQWFEPENAELTAGSADLTGENAELTAAKVKEGGNATESGNAAEGGDAVAFRSSGGLTVRISIEDRERGVEILPLERAAAHPEHGERIRRRLGSAVGDSFGRLEALDAAIWSRGVYLHVPRGVRTSEPLRVEFNGASDSIDGRRVLMIVEENAEAMLVEQHSGDAADGRCWGVSEVFVGEGARVDYVLLQTLDDSITAHLSQRIVLERDAHARSSLVSFGGRKTKVDTGTLLAGEGSEAETVGLLYGHGRQFFDHHTDHHHSAPHTDSNLDFKVVLSGRSRSSYTGNITIEKKAPFSSAFQENRNLLLSEKARADSIPELEIDIDEVQCSHGATIGPISPDELFYLMSRGIPEKEAVKQIVQGFLEAILQKIPADLQEPLREELAVRLEEIRA